MTSREIVRTALVVGGVWIGVSAASSLAPSVIQFVDLYSSIDGGLSDFARKLFLPTGFTIFFALILGLAPALYLIGRSRVWATALAPDDGLEAEIEPSLVLAVALLILGLSIAVDGVADILFNTIRLMSLVLADQAWSIRGPAVGGLLSAIFRLVAGVLIYRRGRRSVLHAA